MKLIASRYLLPMTLIFAGCSTSAEPKEISTVFGKTAKIDAAGLVVTMSAEATYPAGSAVLVQTVVHNAGPATRTFCDYHTPFEGIRNDIFVIKNGQGEALEYQGMMAKRAAPGAENYLRVKAGGRKSAEVDLRDAYELPVGKYEVSYRGTDISGLADSEPVTFEVTGL